VHSWPEYCTANAGFCFDFQLINVEDFNGVGESEPNPYFYQVSWMCIIAYSFLAVTREYYVTQRNSRFWVAPWMAEEPLSLRTTRPYTAKNAEPAA
jgi:hypothetical protein